MKNSRRTTPRLTPRERQVLSLVAHGYTSKQIGEKLGISPRTAETHRVNIGRRLGIRNVAQMVRYAIEAAREELNGWHPLPEGALPQASASLGAHQ